MNARLAPLALVATACSPGGDATPANGVAPTADATAMQQIAPASAGAPRPGTLRTFRDWTVGCDNGGTCTMASLGPEAGDFPPVTVRVSREAGPRGGWSVALASDDAPPHGVAIDGKRVAVGGQSYSGAQAAAIVAAMANGRSLTATDRGGKATATVSLAGASAALRYIDAAQGRAGTVTAAVASGTKAADTVPSPPELPSVTAIAPGGVAGSPTSAQIASMRATAGCDTDGFAASTDPEMHAIGGGVTLVFVPCSAGAYNVSAALFLLRGKQVAPALADVPTGFGGEEPSDAPAQVVNGDFENGLVTSYSKGRGLGDCGIEQRFAWDGTKLRLVEQGEMGECRGNTDLITVWRARVVRK